MTDLISKLPNVHGEYRPNAPLAQLTWFKVGGNAEVLFKPLDFDDLQFFLVNVPKNIPITVIGACSNMLIRDGGIDGVVIKLGRNFTEIALLPDNLIRVGAAALNYNTAQFCLQNSIEGFEFLIGIPGTAGGGIAMNAGAYGSEFKDIVYCVEALTLAGEKLILTPNEIGFGYRSNSLKDIIFTSMLCKYTLGNKDAIKAKVNEIVESRLRTQPVKEKTCGSTFANPTDNKAWQLVDNSGMKGAKVGDAEISRLHSNFIINNGSATAKDIENLGEMVRNKVFEDSGIMLEWEIKRVGK